MAFPFELGMALSPFPALTCLVTARTVRFCFPRGTGRTWRSSRLVYCTYPLYAIY